MPCLTSVQQFKDYLGLTSTSEDAQLHGFLDATEEAIERFCRRKFKSAAYTEYHDGHGLKNLFLEQRPVTAITGVWVDDDGYYGTGSSPFPSSDQWTSGTDFALKRSDQSEKNAGCLVALRGLGLGNGYWPKGDGNIKVTYTAGYTAIPEDLILAIHLLASQVRNAAEKGIPGALKSETQGRYSYEILTGTGAEAGDLSGTTIVQALSILKPYREVLA